MGTLGPRKYSERLGVIDAEQLQSVAERFGLGTVLGAEPATEGLFGQIIMLETTEGDFVMRGNPHGLVQLTKERKVAEVIDNDSSLPAPWPYDIAESDENFEWPYAVMPDLGGETGSVLRETLDDRARIDLARAHGNALAALHEVEGDFPGPYDGQLDTFIEMDDFGDWVLHRLEHWRSACRAVNALSTEAEVLIDELIESSAEALDEPMTPVLVHHDFTLGNVNFDDDLEPTGVFDLHESYFGDGEEDLVRMLWQFDPNERKAFVEAYTDVWPLRPGASDRLAIYALSDWLVIWEYGARVAGWFTDDTFVGRVTPIIRNARAVAGE